VVGSVGVEAGAVAGAAGAVVVPGVVAAGSVVGFTSVLGSAGAAVADWSAGAVEFTAGAVAGEVAACVGVGT